MENNPLDEISKQIQEMFRQEDRKIAEALSPMLALAAQRMAQPDLAGWLQLLEILREAAKDEKILASPEASAFLEKMLKLARDASIGTTAEEVLQPLSTEFISKNASKAAKTRFGDNEKVREWVRAEWVKNKDDEYKNNKTYFAYDYSRRIWNEYEIKVALRTISDRWLRGL